MFGNSILDNFDLPAVAVEAIKNQKLKMSQSPGGFEYLVAEHAGGLPFRFFIYTEYAPIQSKLLGYEKFNDIDCIEWTIDKGNEYPARLTELPPELLRFEVTGYKEAAVPHPANDPYAHPIYGECVGGQLKEAYDRFKKGLATPGLPLNKWGVLADAECATLASYAIYSVEQFAAMPRSKIMNGNFPINMQEAFERACLYVNGKENRIKDKDLADKLMAMAQDNAKLEERLAAFESKLNAPKKTWSRKKKVQTNLPAGE